jgi:hypothetical protein
VSTLSDLAAGPATAAATAATVATTFAILWFQLEGVRGATAVIPAPIRPLPHHCVNTKGGFFSYSIAAAAATTSDALGNTPRRTARLLLELVDDDHIHNHPKGDHGENIDRHPSHFYYSM